MYKMSSKGRRWRGCGRERTPFVYAIDILNSILHRRKLLWKSFRDCGVAVDVTPKASENVGRSFDNLKKVNFGREASVCGINVLASLNNTIWDI